MRTYQVQSGDSWASIAGKIYGDQRMFAEIMRQNAGVTMLRPGMVIDLPERVADPFVANQLAVAVGMAPTTAYTATGAPAGWTPGGVTAPSTVQGLPPGEIIQTAEGAMLPRVGTYTPTTQTIYGAEQSEALRAQARGVTYNWGAGVLPTPGQLYSPLPPQHGEQYAFGQVTPQMRPPTASSEALRAQQRGQTYGGVPFGQITQRPQPTITLPGTRPEGALPQYQYPAGYQQVPETERARAEREEQRVATTAQTQAQAQIVQAAFATGDMAAYPEVIDDATLYTIYGTGEGGGQYGIIDFQALNADLTSRGYVHDQRSGQWVKIDRAPQIYEQFQYAINTLDDSVLPDSMTYHEVLQVLPRVGFDTPEEIKVELEALGYHRDNMTWQWIRGTPTSSVGTSTVGANYQPGAWSADYYWSTIWPALNVTPPSGYVGGVVPTGYTPGGTLTVTPPVGPTIFQGNTIWRITF